MAHTRREHKSKVAKHSSQMRKQEASHRIKTNDGTPAAQHIINGAIDSNGNINWFMVVIAMGLLAPHLMTMVQAAEVTRNNNGHDQDRADQNSTGLANVAQYNDTRVVDFTEDSHGMQTNHNDTANRMYNRSNSKQDSRLDHYSSPSTKNRYSFHYPVPNPQYNSKAVTHQTQERKKSINKQRKDPTSASSDLTLDDILENVKFHFGFDLLKTEHPKLKDIHIKRFIDRVKQLISKLTINCDVLRAVLLDNSFSIRIASKREAKAVVNNKGKSSFHAAGYYNSQKNMIGICYNHNASNSTLTKLLSNEFHHAAITRTNRDLVGKPAYSVFAALDKDGNISDEFSHQLWNALLDSNARIQKFLIAAISKKYGPKLDSAQREMLKALIKVSEGYIPLEYYHVVSRSDFEEMKNNDVIRHDKSGHLFLDTQFAVFIKGGRFQRYILDAEEKGDQVRFKLAHAVPNSNSKFDIPYAALLDIVHQYAQYYEGIYGLYSGVKEDGGNVMLIEWLSTIEEFSDGIKQLIFPELCDYLTKYHEVEDYCDSRCPKTGSPGIDGVRKSLGM